MRKTTLLILSILMLPLVFAQFYPTALAVLPGQGQVVSPVTYDGYSLINDPIEGTYFESPAGKTFPAQITYNTQPNFSFPLTIVNEGDLTDVQIEVSQVYGTGFEYGDMSMAHSLEPDVTIPVDSLSAGEMRTFNITAAPRTATNVLDAPNPLESVGIGISNFFIGIGNFFGGLIGNEPAPLLPTDTVTSGQVTFLMANLVDSDGETLDQMGIVLVSGTPRSDSDPFNPDFGEDVGDESGFGFDVPGSQQQSISADSGFGFDLPGSQQESI